MYSKAGRLAGAVLLPAAFFILCTGTEAKAQGRQGRLGQRPQQSFGSQRQFQGRMSSAGGQCGGQQNQLQTPQQNGLQTPQSGQVSTLQQAQLGAFQPQMQQLGAMQMQQLIALQAQLDGIQQQQLNARQRQQANGVQRQLDALQRKLNALQAQQDDE